MGEFLRRPFPVTFSSGLQTSSSSLSETETIVFGQKRNSGEGKKKKQQASLLVSFANGAGLGIADAGTVLESTICHSCLTRRRDIFKCCCRTNVGKHACCLPKTSFNKVQLLLLQICRGKVFPTWNFELFFFFHLLSENELSGSTFGEMGFLPYEMWIQDKNGLHSRNSGRAKVKTLPQVQNGNVCRGVSGVKHTGIPTATFGVKETLVIHPLLVFKDFLHFLKECPSHCLLSWVFVHGV